LNGHLNKHFTVTTYVFHDGKTLLHFHEKLQKLLPPGGHLEANELPTEAAKREVKEETGLEIELVLQENLFYENWNATSFPRPYLCLLEMIPERKHEPAHYHMDLIYLAKLASSQENIKSPFDWYSFEQIIQLKDRCFPDLIDVLESLRSSDYKFLLEKT
jgi:ADP-ribose pyrophosphatase YjhB (NUDIX family)